MPIQNRDGSSNTEIERVIIRENGVNTVIRRVIRREGGVNTVVFEIIGAMWSAWMEQSRSGGTESETRTNIGTASGGTESETRIVIGTQMGGTPSEMVINMGNASAQTESNNVITCTNWSPTSAASSEEFIDQTRTCTETYDLSASTRTDTYRITTSAITRTDTYRIDTTAETRTDTYRIDTTETTINETRECLDDMGMSTAVTNCPIDANNRDTTRVVTIPASSRMEDRLVTITNASTRNEDRVVEITPASSRDEDRVVTVTAASTGNTRPSSTGPAQSGDTATLVSGSNTGTSRRIENPSYVQPVDGTADWGPYSGTGSITGGTPTGVYTVGSFGNWMDDGTATASDEFLNEFRTAPTTERYDNASQDGIRTCNLVTSPSSGGNAGRCSNPDAAIGDTDTAPGHFTNRMRQVSVTPTIANGGRQTRTGVTPNPAYVPPAVDATSATVNPTSHTFNFGIADTVNVSVDVTPNNGQWHVTTAGAFTSTNTGTTIGDDTITISYNGAGQAGRATNIRIVSGASGSGGTILATIVVEAS